MLTRKVNQHDLEADINAIGREIFKRAEAAAPSIFSVEFWQQFAMNRMTADEDLKLRLFRFIEVLPSLQDSTTIARSLREHLKSGSAKSRNATSPDGHTSSQNGRQPLPPLLDLAVSYDNPNGIFAHAVAKAALIACEQGARKFIVGSTPDQAIASVRQLRRRNMCFTLDLLGETTLDDDLARQHQMQYITLIEQLSRQAREWPAVPLLDTAPWGSLPRINVSVKLSAIVANLHAIASRSDAEAVLERLRPILRAARLNGAFINIDMEYYAAKDLTLDVFKRVLTEPEFRDWEHCGIVIQAYLRDAESDMRSMIDWARPRGATVTVRVVKGAYWDSEVAAARRDNAPIPVYTEKWESDASFERVAELLLRNADVIRPAFASHNVRSIAAVLAMEAAMGLPPRTLELQMLTGMGDPLKRAVVSMGQRLRVYAPFGDMLTGMAYLIRRLIENTANESFLRQSFAGNTPVEQMLAPPGAFRPQGATGCSHG
ncbi:MAG TPA: proline dehydrogenase family protein [Phycisphaerae bacterium]|nr:proline dehydrogenase family protein [Phycisphaerae bacterium]